MAADQIARCYRHIGKRQTLIRLYPEQVTLSKIGKGTQRIIP